MGGVCVCQIYCDKFYAFLRGFGGIFVFVTPLIGC